MEIIFGTGNPAKYGFMKRALKGLPLILINAKEKAGQMGIDLPYVKETGQDIHENAAIKADAYYRVFHAAVVSCDTALYLFDYKTGQLLPKEEQPGIHVRGRESERLTDDELILKYTCLFPKYGKVMGRYENAVCLIDDMGVKIESTGQNLYGEAFLLGNKPHKERNPGFPIDSISIDMETGKYYYDLEENKLDKIAGLDHLRQYFCNFLFS